MLDVIDYNLPAETHPAFLAIGESDVGHAFLSDCKMLAAECAQFAAAPAEWHPDTAEKLLAAQTGRARWLAGQIFLTAWATDTSQEAAAEFASIIGYIASDTIMTAHILAGNADRSYVEFMTYCFEVDFGDAFAKLMGSGAFATPRTVH